MAQIRQVQRSQTNFNDVMAIAQDAIMSRLNCHNIGRIIDFDKDTQTCMVELMQIKQFNKQTFIPAPITQVPLIILGAGGGHITMPNPVGTICLLLFLDRNIDNFMETGEQYVPDTSRMHDFTDCVALTTFTTLINPLQNYDEDAISIFNEKVIEEVTKLSYIKIYPASIQVQAADGANITLNDKVSISNTAQDLGALIKELITDIKGLSINTNTGTVTQGSQDILDGLAEKFAQLINTPEEN
jgi:hypothetical protein